MLSIIKMHEVKSKLFSKTIASFRQQVAPADLRGRGADVAAGHVDVVVVVGVLLAVQGGVVLGLGAPVPVSARVTHRHDDTVADRGAVRGDGGGGVRTEIPDTWPVRAESRRPKRTFS